MKIGEMINTYKAATISIAEGALDGALVGALAGISFFNPNRMLVAGMIRNDRGLECAPCPLLPFANEETCANPIAQACYTVGVAMLCGAVIGGVVRAVKVAFLGGPATPAQAPNAHAD